MNTTKLATAVEAYLADLRRIRASGGATGERSYYSPLANLLNAVGDALKPKVFCVGELAQQGAGHPDFGLYTAKQVQRGRPRDGQLPEYGVVEVKSAGDDSWLTAEGSQVKVAVDEFRRPRCWARVTGRSSPALATGGHRRRFECGRGAQVAASIGYSLFLAGFPVPKPLSQKRGSTFLPLQDTAPTPSFGGFGLREWWGLDGLEPPTSVLSGLRANLAAKAPVQSVCQVYGRFELVSFDQRRQIVGFRTVGTVGGNRGDVRAC